MSDQKLSQLATTTALASTDKVYAIESLVSKAMTVKDFGRHITGVIDVKRDFDAVGDGITNDTAAIQAAIDAVGAQGGVVLVPPGKYLVDGLTLKKNVALIGQSSIGEDRANFGDWDHEEGSVLIQRTTTSITVQHRNTIAGLVLLRDGLGDPPTSEAEALAAIAAFQGKAIDAPASSISGGTNDFSNDIVVRDVLAIGHEYAFWSAGHERPFIDRLYGDCTNGVYIEDCRDIARISRCHMWPFWVSHRTGWTTTPGNHVTFRNGMAFKLVGDVGWAVLENCFSIGHLVGFYSESQRTRMASCGADFFGGEDAGAYGASGTIGFHLNNKTSLQLCESDLSGCVSNSHYRGFVIDIDNGVDAENTCTLRGGKSIFADAGAIGVDVVSGSATLIAQKYRGNAGQTGLKVQATAGRVTAIGDTFGGGLTFYDIAAGKEGDVQIVGNQSSTGAVNLALPRLRNGHPFATFADQDATPSVVGGSRFKTANTIATTITNLDQGYDGQEVVVVFGDALTTIDFTASAMKGNAGADWTPAVNDSMSCVYDGTNWFCDVSDNSL